MKYLFTLFAAVCILQQTFSQPNTTRINQYILPVSGEAEQSVILTMPYGDFNITSISGDTMALKNAGDIMIDVVCTDYPNKASLEPLNRSRFNEIFKHFPFIKPRQVRQINYIRQTDGTDKEQALSMFHGIVIKYRPVQNAETMKQDLKKLEDIVGGTATTGASVTDSEVPVVDEKTSVAPTESGRVSIYNSMAGMRFKNILAVVGDKKYLEETFDIPDSIKIMTPGEAFNIGYITKELLKTHQQFSTSHSIVGDYETVGTVSFASPLTDSTVFKTFTRNKWKNITVVGDVTGSMYPYTAQLLLWLKLHSLDSLTNKFAFFNDGDNKADQDKEIGHTGGIYHKRCNSFEEVQEIIKHTMMRGGGGDCPENNIEALMEAERQFPEAACQVLIADNWANIKDKTLIDKLKKPVRVVICGAGDYNINTDYLTLAYKTKGSVHLMEQDLYNLSMLHNGETITIGRKKFVLKDGAFIEKDGTISTISHSATL